MLRLFDEIRGPTVVSAATVLLFAGVALGISGCTSTTKEKALYSGGDLSGTWVATGYKCNGFQPPEIVSIKQEDRLVIATKVTGDDCVKAGLITWTGEFPIGSGNQFDVRFHVSRGPDMPTFFIPTTVRVADLDTLVPRNGNREITFARKK